MTIINLKWKSDEYVEITLSDGNFTIICLADPFNLEDYNKGTYNIYCYDAIDLHVIKKEDKFYNLIKMPDYFSYKVYGKLINIKKRIVKVGGFEFYISKGTLPGDIKENEFITFKCSRFDLW